MRSEAATETLGGLLDAVRSRFALVNDAEVTVETEPGTTDAETFAALAGHGVNRVTIGVQSFDDAHLATLGRAHSSCDARAAIAACREGGITNLDLDLMFGLPGQTLASWRADLAEAVLNEAKSKEDLAAKTALLEQSRAAAAADLQESSDMLAKAQASKKQLETVMMRLQNVENEFAAT